MTLSFDAESPLLFALCSFPFGLPVRKMEGGQASEGRQWKEIKFLEIFREMWERWLPNSPPDFQLKLTVTGLFHNVQLDLEEGGRLL
jgi:hypothetical protein